MTLDVATVVRDINHFLGLIGWAPRDADGNDFACFSPTHTSDVRFKTGTSRGEVTILVVKNDGLVDTIRILNEERVDEAKAQIERWAFPIETVEITDGVGNVIDTIEVPEGEV